MFNARYIFIAMLAFIVVVMIPLSSNAQALSDTVFYVCAEAGYNIAGPTGFDHYIWTEDGNNMTGTDSSNIHMQALGAAVVANQFVLKTYHVNAYNNGNNLTNEATYVVYILPKINVAVTGYVPPYCENASYAITLSAQINGSPAASVLTLPAGVNVQYTWSVEPDNGNPATDNWNAAITGASDQSTVQVITPQSSNTDNNYTLKIAYSYPPSVDTNTNVVGDCSDSFMQNVHADAAPQTPTISYQEL